MTFSLLSSFFLACTITIFFFFFLMIRRPPRSTLSLHDALPIFAHGCLPGGPLRPKLVWQAPVGSDPRAAAGTADARGTRAVQHSKLIKKWPGVGSSVPRHLNS